VCNDADAKRLMDQLGGTDKSDVRIERATHLMHLESQRTVLHGQVSAFLRRVATTTGDHSSRIRARTA